MRRKSIPRRIGRFAKAAAVTSFLVGCGAGFEIQKPLPDGLAGNMSVVGLVIDAERKTPTRPAYIKLPPELAVDVRNALEHRFIAYPNDGTPVHVAIVFSHLSRFDPNDPLPVGGSNRMQAWLEVREADQDGLLGRYEITVSHSSYGLLLALSDEAATDHQRAAVADLANAVDRILRIPGSSG